MWLLIAEAGDPISLTGGAGWAGAGLLGLVLAWLLFFHLPAKDKQLQKMIEDKDTITRDLAREYSTALSDSRKEFRESLQFIAANDAASIKSLADTIAKDLHMLHNAIESNNNNSSRA